MSHRFLPLIIVVVISYSCVTNNSVDKNENENTKVKPVYIENEIVEKTSADELILLDSLDWSSPGSFKKQLDKKTPLPVLHFRESHRSQKDVQAEVEAEQILEKEPESTSFLEIIINSENNEKDDEEDSAIEKIDNLEQVVIVQENETAIIEETVIEVDTEEVETVEVETVEVEYIKAAVREVSLVECETEGWLLDGITDIDGNIEENLRFKGRDYLGGNTVFSFYPYKTGVYIIKLRKSDLSTGTVLQKKVKLEVVENLDEVKIDELKINEVEKSDEVVVSDDLNAALIQKEKPVEVIKKLSSANEILSAVAALESAGDCIGAAELLKDSLEIIEADELDSVYFRLGGLYESCSSLRDERTAIEYYKKIVDYYPVSNYWIEAKEKIIYLERNFIFIR